MQHRQAADARVEHADRPLVHLRDCREAGCRLPSLRAPAPPPRRACSALGSDLDPPLASSRSTYRRPWMSASSIAFDRDTPHGQRLLPAARTCPSRTGSLANQGHRSARSPSPPQRGTPRPPTTRAATRSPAATSSCLSARSQPPRRSVALRRPPTSATRFAPGASLTAAAHVWNALTPERRSGRVEVLKTWTDLYSLFGRSTLAKLRHRAPLLGGISALAARRRAPATTLFQIDNLGPDAALAPHVRRSELLLPHDALLSSSRHRSSTPSTRPRRHAFTQLTCPKKLVRRSASAPSLDLPRPRRRLRRSRRASSGSNSIRRRRRTGSTRRSDREARVCLCMRPTEREPCHENETVCAAGTVLGAERSRRRQTAPVAALENCAAVRARHVKRAER